MFFKNLVFFIVYSNVRFLITRDSTLTSQSFNFLNYINAFLRLFKFDFSYDFAHEIKSLIIFFEILNNAIVYSLMLFCFIVTSNNNSSNNFFNILLNFFIFITF